MIAQQKSRIIKKVPGDHFGGEGGVRGPEKKAGT
jgi:hypothetical protein